ncbi:MAG TPA: hypothetical protein VII06_41395 [Chloroflexota bacterium]|jgi:hypothetical protein
MVETEQVPPGGWWIRPTTLPAFAYDPRFHSRLYVLNYLERAGATEAEVNEVIRSARDLEQQAVALGYDLAEAEHGMDEVLDTHSPRFTPPGPNYGSSPAAS